MLFDWLVSRERKSGNGRGCGTYVKMSNMIVREAMLV